jgi:hypothetical protein
VAELRKEIEASQRATVVKTVTETSTPRAPVNNPPDRILEQLRQRRLAEGVAAQGANPKAPQVSADEAHIIITGLGGGGTVMLGDGKPGAPQVRREQGEKEGEEALKAAVKALAAAKGEQGPDKLIINGREVKLGDGKTIILGDGKPAAREGREDQERMQRQVSAELEKALAQLAQTEAAKQGQRLDKLVINGREVKPGDGAKEGQDGVTFTISGMEFKVDGEGKMGEGKLVVVPDGRPGQPVPGAVKPLPPGGAWKQLPGAPVIGRPGAAAEKPGSIVIFGEAQAREGREGEAREAEEREARERRGGGERHEFHVTVPPPPGANPMPGGPRPPGMNPWHPPMPGGPQAGQPVASNPVVAGMQQLQQMMAMLHTFKEVAFNSETAAMIAIGGIKDENPRKPDLAIKTLEGTLKKVRTLGLRTAIHMNLKDLYKAQGNEEMVMEHLRDMLLENDEALQEHKGPMFKRGGNEAGADTNKMKSGRKDRKDKDDDDDD